MKNLIMTNTLVRVSIIVLLLFVVLALFVAPDRMTLYLDAARIGVYAVLLFVVSRRAWELYWGGAKTGGEIAAVALSTLALTILLHSIWAPARRDFGHLVPDWLERSHISSFIVLLYCMAGVGFLMPIGNVTGVTQPRNYWFLVAAGVIFGLSAGLMIGLGIQAVPD